MDDGTNITTRKEKPREKQHGDLKVAIEAALGPIRNELAELPRLDAINKLLEDAILKIEEKIEEKITVKSVERAIPVEPVETSNSFWETNPVDEFGVFGV